MNKIKGVIFDIDGTLLDSLTLIKEAWNITTEKHLGWKYSEDKLNKIVGLPLRQQLDQLSPENSSDMEKTYRDFQKANHDKLVKLYPGVTQLLNNLHSKQIKLAVATSKARVGMELSRPLFGDDCPISVWITVDDVKHHKPHPEGLLLAASKIELNPEECAYVGDSVYDVEAAKAAGMMSISVGWGVTELDKLDGDFKVKTLLELENTILNKHC